MKTFERLTFEQWWEGQPIARLPDSSRGAYLRDLSHRVWISAQQAMGGYYDESSKLEVHNTTVINISKPAVDAHEKLVERAVELFLENTQQDLERYSVGQLQEIIEQEENDRRHGTRPNYRIDDVCTDHDWTAQ